MAFKLIESQLRHFTRRDFVVWCMDLANATILNTLKMFQKSLFSQSERQSAVHACCHLGTLSTCLGCRWLDRQQGYLQADLDWVDWPRLVYSLLHFLPLYTISFTLQLILSLNRQSSLGMTLMSRYCSCPMSAKNGAAHWSRYNFSGLSEKMQWSLTCGLLSNLVYLWWTELLDRTPCPW